MKQKKHDVKYCKCKSCTLKRLGRKKGHRLDCRCSKCRWLRTSDVSPHVRPTLGTAWQITPKEISWGKMAKLRKKYAKYIDAKVEVD